MCTAGGLSKHLAGDAPSRNTPKYPRANQSGSAYSAAQGGRGSAARRGDHGAEPAHALDDRQRRLVREVEPQEVVADVIAGDVERAAGDERDLALDRRVKQLVGVEP